MPPQPERCGDGMGEGATGLAGAVGRLGET